MDITQIAFTVSVWTLPVLLAVTLHEAAHGWVAWKLGDDTAKRLGRVTFNPFKHIDPFGTVFLPAMLLIATSGAAMFGYAKPVPVNFARLTHFRRDMVLVAAAGPGANLALATVSVAASNLVYLVPPSMQEWVSLNLDNSAIINLVLCVFNMLPLPPLDGGRVAVGILPAPLANPLARLERVGIIIVLAALFILPYVGRKLGIDLDLFRWLIGRPVEWLSMTIVAVFGS